MGEASGEGAGVEERADEGELAAPRSKFDIGTPPEPPEAAVPWGYGADRITALVRSPDSLYLFWEITDEGLSAARARLGPAGAHGWCNLRVYDTTGRSFDGTNANSYFDIRVERTDREYFLSLHRPASAAHVEIGVKTHEGYFQAIARSGRAEFPRKSPSSSDWVDWMTVTGGPEVPAARPYESRYTGPEPLLPGGPQPPEPPGPTAQLMEMWTTEHAWTVESYASGEWESFGGFELSELTELPWLLEHWRTEWRSMHVDPSRFRIEIRAGGPVVVHTEWGPIEVHGPWRVMVRDFGAGPDRRVLASWTMHWVRVAPVVVERWITGVERRSVAAFRRERFAVGGSEAWLSRELGASEMWRLGASERLWLGASAGMMAGASEVWRLGASEWMWLGASAGMMAGASGAFAWGASGAWPLGGSERVSGSTRGGG